MSETRINIYEGVFLFPQAATADLQSAVDHVKEILSRADAEIVSLRKWDERRLAYEIKGNKRGVYFLVYFNAPAEKIHLIERACNLSEQLLRSIVTRADHLPKEQIEAAEGRAELADEIKMRAADPAGATAGSSSRVETGSDTAPAAKAATEAAVADEAGEESETAEEASAARER